MRTRRSPLRRVALGGWTVSRPLPLRQALAFVALLAASTASRAAADDTDAAAGKAILEKNCAKCHSIEATGDSPLAKAPPLRQVYLKYPIEQLEEGFAEGMGSRHRDMPQIQFSPDQVEAILSYLGSITGVDPRSGRAFPRAGKRRPSQALRRGEPSAGRHRRCCSAHRRTPRRSNNGTRRSSPGESARWR